MKIATRKASDFKVLTQFEILVPADYLHERAVSLKPKDKKLFFPEPSRQLIPGETLLCRIYEQQKPGKTSTLRRFNFLKNQKGNVFVGIWGILQAKSHMSQDLNITGIWYHGLDKPSSLFRDVTWELRTPGIYRSPSGELEVMLTSTSPLWNEKFLLIGFQEKGSIV